MNLKDFATDVKKQQKELFSDIIKKVQVNINNMKTDEDIVGLKKGGIILLIPRGYSKTKEKNPVLNIIKNISNNEATYVKVGNGYRTIVTFFETDKTKAMDFKDVTGLIKGIHENMTDKEGLIEVKAGTTKCGYNYIYSIVKGLRDDQGIFFYIRLNLKYGSEILEVRAVFEEIGITGERAAVVFQMANIEKLVEVTDDNIIGWSEDPYDKEYNKGVFMNLADKEGIDGLFPDSPLSQAREFLYAVLEDKYVLTKEDVDKSKTDGEQKETEGNNESNAEILKKLLSDGCRRYIKDVDVKR